MAIDASNRSQEYNRDYYAYGFDIFVYTRLCIANLSNDTADSLRVINLLA